MLAEDVVLDSTRLAEEIAQRTSVDPSVQAAIARAFDLNLDDTKGRFVAAAVVVDVGTSSIVYRIGLFQGDSDEAAAEGRFVHVYVDNSRGAGDRPVVPMPDAVREAVVPLLR